MLRRDTADRLYSIVIDTIEDAYYLAGKFAENDFKVKIKAIYNIIF